VKDKLLWLFLLIITIEYFIFYRDVASIFYPYNISKECSYFPLSYSFGAFIVNFSLAQTMHIHPVPPFMELDLIPIKPQPICQWLSLGCIQFSKLILQVWVISQWLNAIYALLTNPILPFNFTICEMAFYSPPQTQIFDHWFWTKPLSLRYLWLTGSAIFLWDRS
jgi:hypothetical protein